MSIIAEFTLASKEFALGSLVESTDMKIEIDRMLPATSGGIPYVWATGHDFETFERVIESSPLIESITAIDRQNGSSLYRIDWASDAETLLQEIANSNISILEAYRDEDWHFRLRFDSHSDLEKFHTYCSRRDINYQLERINSSGDESARDYEFGLSAIQRDTLVLAIEQGYFNIPRGITLEELGAELGISQQAASERVRRAANKVLRTVFSVSTTS